MLELTAVDFETGVHLGLCFLRADAVSAVAPAIVRGGRPATCVFVEGSRLYVAEAVELVREKLEEAFDAMDAEG